jgi:hypothetical protein
MSGVAGSTGGAAPRPVGFSCSNLPHGVLFLSVKQTQCTGLSTNSFVTELRSHIRRIIQPHKPDLMAMING